MNKSEKIEWSGLKNGLKPSFIDVYKILRSAF